MWHGFREKQGVISNYFCPQSAALGGVFRAAKNLSPSTASGDGNELPKRMSYHVHSALSFAFRAWTSQRDVPT
jgi:hypothetical protein